MKYKVFILMFLTALSSCIDPLDVELEEHQSKLVVLAEVSNKDEAYQVQLSRTTTYDISRPRVVDDALVFLTDEEGNEFNLDPIGEGKYITCTQNFVGQVGKAYQLNIITTGFQGSQKVYQSSFETIPEPVTIDSLYYEITTETLSSQAGTYEERGLAFYCDFKDNPEKEYLWFDWEGVFKFEASGYDQFFDYCWKTEVPEFDVNLFDDRYTNNSLYQNFKLAFLPKGFRFKEGYSFELQAKSINAGAYEFWSQIRQQIENDGSIFSALPSRINSNISCISDPNEEVLGYFIASGISKERVMISKYTFPDITAQLPSCVPFRPSNPLPEYCYDCRLYPNSTSSKPAFWED